MHELRAGADGRDEALAQAAGARRGNKVGPGTADNSLILCNLFTDRSGAGSGVRRFSLDDCRRCKGCIGYGADATEAALEHHSLHQGPRPPAPAQKTQHGRHQGPGRIDRDGHSTSPHRACRQRKGATDAAWCCIRYPVVRNGVECQAVCAERGATEPGTRWMPPLHHPRRASEGRTSRTGSPQERPGIGDGHRHCAGSTRGLECVPPHRHRRAHRGGGRQAGKTAGGFERASGATSRTWPLQGLTCPGAYPHRQQAWRYCVGRGRWRAGTGTRRCRGKGDLHPLIELADSVGAMSEFLPSLD